MLVPMEVETGTILTSGLSGGIEKTVQKTMIAVNPVL